LNLDLVAAARQFNPLIVLIHSDSQALLRLVLTDNVFIEEVLDLAGLWQWWTRGHRLSLLVVADDLVADVDALVANIDSGACNEFLNFILRLSAEGTTECVVSSSYHGLGNSILF